MNHTGRPGFQTEIEFILPKGYVDGDGSLHRDGVMRLATAADEILPLRDPRVQQNPAYLTIIVLARVVVRLGALTNIDTRLIENLFASDLNYLQRLYERLNGSEEADDAVEVGAGRRLNGSSEGGIGVLGEA
jgi:hypothetical protein